MLFCFLPSPSTLLQISSLVGQTIRNNFDDINPFLMLLLFDDDDDGDSSPAAFHAVATLSKYGTDNDPIEEN